MLYAPLWLLKKPPTLFRYGRLSKCDQKDGPCKRPARNPERTRGRNQSAELVRQMVGRKPLPPTQWGQNKIRRCYEPPMACSRTSSNSSGRGIPVYDPAQIRVPTLLIRAEWDADTPLYMAEEVFNKLVNTPYKSLVVPSGGTHTAVLEKNRMRLISQVQFSWKKNLSGAFHKFGHTFSSRRHVGCRQEEYPGTEARATKDYGKAQSIFVGRASCPPSPLWRQAGVRG